ncbi:hypothetical protein NP233_g8203 [Leucocoprinus birnbaumii]|uniref:Arrestin C-terminal-like domain-containing protein n=1 Tax=Leucocoprinus birnbaumii TaxID=56174 RepID=A0AAD5VRA5_9AGAR|nr:hypothetical protein NP233_g8203 [Leucocoprinus birnbaumii]
MNPSVGSSQNHNSHNTQFRPQLTLGDPNLARHGTLLTSNATPARAAAELKSILGNHNARLKSEAALIRMDSGSAAFNRHVTLEQAKRRARVEVDILPQTNVCVQGGYLRGHVKIFIRKATRKEAPIFIAGGKIRVVGFESLGEKSRSIFYQCSAMLASITPSLDGLYASERDAEGFSRAVEGEHELPFALYLSLTNDDGQAKGSLKFASGIALNYIAMISLKIKDEPGRRSIAHFYRCIEVWPRLDPSTVLSTAVRPLQATVSTNVTKHPDSGRIRLMASLHRLHWVAGQACHVKVIVDNGTNKTLKGLALSLHRTITIFPHSLGGSLDSDLDSRQPETSTRQVAESVLEAGQARSKEHASAKGWWLGVRPYHYAEFEHSIMIPMDALTVPRGRVFEVEYSLRVAINSSSPLSSDLEVTLPIRIVGFLSIDPPPSHPISTLSQMLSSAHQLSSREDSNTTGSGSTTFNAVGKIGKASHISKEAGNQLFKGHKNAASSNYTRNLSNRPLLFPGREQDMDDSFLDCNNDELGNLELGNLSVADDTDDVVQHAITTARMDLTYARFSGLYYSQDENSDRAETNYASLNDGSGDSACHYDSDSVAGALETLMEEVAIENDSHNDLCGVEANPVRRSSGTREPSTFTARVKEKTRMLTAVFLNGDRDTRTRHEQEDPLKHIEDGHRSRKLHLTLEIPPVLGGENVSDNLSGTPQHRLHPSELTSADVHENEIVHGAPVRSGGPHSYEAAIKTPIPEIYRTASVIDIPDSGTSSFSANVRTPPHTDRLRRERDLMPTNSTLMCSHCATQLSDNGTAIGDMPLERTGQQNWLRVDTNNTSLPRAGHSIDADVTSAKTLISPASTTSTTSIGGISVKDKIRQLEERVKVSASM